MDYGGIELAYYNDESTKGSIYILSSSQTPNRFKVGWTGSSRPYHRLKDQQAGTPTPLEIVSYFRATKHFDQYLKTSLRDHRTHYESFEMEPPWRRLSFLIPPGKRGDLTVFHDKTINPRESSAARSLPAWLMIWLNQELLRSKR